MNRITPEMVKEAYEKTGLKPIQDIWYEISSDRCGCGLMAVILSKNPKLESLYEEDDLNNFVDNNSELLLMELENDYISGFIVGFDKGGELNRHDKNAYTEGYRDGKEAWEAVKHLAI